MKSDLGSNASTAGALYEHLKDLSTSDIVEAIQHLWSVQITRSGIYIIETAIFSYQAIVYYPTSDYGSVIISKMTERKFYKCTI